MSRRLEELGVLSQVDTISSASGASILAAKVALADMPRCPGASCLRPTSDSVPRSLRHTLKALNHPDPHWGFILTDVTRGAPGNNERTVFVHDSRRAKPCGLAAELVLPQNELGIEPGTMTEQFAGTHMPSASTRRYRPSSS